MAAPSIYSRDSALYQLQQIVDKTIREADKDGDGKVSFDEFVAVRSEASASFIA